MNTPHKLTLPFFILFGYLLLFVELCFLGSNQQTIFYDQRFFLGERLAAISLNILAQIAFLSIYFFVLKMIDRFFSHYFSKKIRLKLFFLTLFLMLFFFVWFTSWALFRAYGAFLTKDAFDFWFIQPIQLLHWVPMSLFIGIPLLTLGISAFVLFGIPAFLSRFFFSSKKIIVASLLGLIFLIGTSFTLSYLLAPNASRLTEEVKSSFDLRYDLGASTPISIEYPRRLEKSSGSYIAAYYEIQKLFISQKSKLFFAPEIEIKYPKRISTEQYLQTVPPKNRKKYNVLFLLVDSLGNDQLALYGGDERIMPNTNALSRESFVFFNNYTQASHSNYADLGPLCSQYPLRGENTHVYPKNPVYPRTLIYDILKPLGWRTAIISSQNDYWGKLVNFLDTGTLDLYLHAETWGGPTQVAPSDTGFASWVAGTKHAGSIDDRYTIEEAIKWIGTDEKPFFIYMNLQTSHFPYLTPSEFKRPFGPEKLDFELVFGDYPQNKVEVVKKLYSDSLNYVDLQLEKLFQFLKETNRWDDTIIVLTGDTGQAFFEHGFTCHGGALFNEVMKVPLLMKVPGKSPQTFDILSQHVDIPPTILYFLDLPPHPGHQGTNLFEKIQNPSSYCAYMVVQAPYSHQCAIVQGQYKLIYDINSNFQLLFDLTKDPKEQVLMNLAEPAKMNELYRRLLTWRSAQLEYYADYFRQQCEFPPTLSPH